MADVPLRSEVTVGLAAANMPVHSWHDPAPFSTEAYKNAVHYMQVVDKSTTAHERHDFGDAGRLLYDFFWGEFADWYIEAAKARLYGQDPQAALQTRQVRHLLCTAFPHSQGFDCPPDICADRAMPAFGQRPGMGSPPNVSLCVVL